ncbi:MAG: STAS domain-containing protein [Brumimicrobium sp.]|nr:STAS domain-containing protein [Brumimicrobium sp.]
MSLSFNISIHPEGVVVLSLKGKIISDQPFDELIEVIETKIQTGEKSFLIDLKEVSHINSSGLNVLLRIFTRIRNKAGEMVLINPSRTVSKLLTISKLNTVFKMAKTEKEALQLLKL